MRRSLLSVAVYGGIAVLGLLPGLVAPSFDSAVYALIGERLAAGDFPYLDVWDHKPLGTYLFTAAASLLGGPLSTVHASWVVSVLALAVTGLVLASTLRSLGWGWQAWIVAGLAVVELASFPIALGGGLSETVAILPVVLAVRLVVVRPSLARGLISGVLVGIGTAISLQALPALAAIPVMTSFAGRSLRAGGSVVVGAAVAGLVGLMLLASTGTLAAATDAVLVYNVVFSRIAELDSPIAKEALHALLVLSPLIALAVAGLRGSLADSGLRSVAIGALAWLGIEIGFVTFQRRLEIHYVGPLVIPLALLAPAALRWTSTSRPVALVVRSVTAGVLAASVVISAWLVTTETIVALESRSQDAARVKAVGSWIGDHSPDDATIFVWGNTPDVYLEAQRAPSSRYVYLLPLLTPGYADEERIRSVLADWEATKPAVIVDAGSSEPGAEGLPPLLEHRPTHPLDGRNLDILEPLRAFVRDGYVEAAVVDGWPVYVRAGSSP